MKLRCFSFLMVLSCMAQTIHPASSSLYHRIIPALDQQGSECGIHALFNAYCFVTGTNNLDKKELETFRQKCLALHGPVGKYGMYSNKLFELKEKLIPPCDKARTAMLILNTTKRKDLTFICYESLLQELMWFHSDCATKKLSVIFLHTKHYNTFNFSKTPSGSITLDVADSSPNQKRIYAQARIIKEMALQAQQVTLLHQPKQTKSSKKSKKHTWIKIAYFNSFSGASPLHKRPFSATLTLW